MVELNRSVSGQYNAYDIEPNGFVLNIVEFTEIFARGGNPLFLFITYKRPSPKQFAANASLDLHEHQGICRRTRIKKNKVDFPPWAIVVAGDKLKPFFAKMFDAVFFSPPTKPVPVGEDKIFIWTKPYHLACFRVTSGRYVCCAAVGV